MTKQPRDARLLSFFKETLDLWQIDGIVEPGSDRAIAVVRAATGAIIWIERADEGPFRWLVRWRSAGEAPNGAREMRPRGCASLLGVLSAMRAALGADRGAPLRVAPASLVA